MHSGTFNELEWADGVARYGNQYENESHDECFAFEVIDYR
jgi:hypothetical protein